jgi:hypothetical protein
MCTGVTVRSQWLLVCLLTLNIQYDDCILQMANLSLDFKGEIHYYELSDGKDYRSHSLQIVPAEMEQYHSPSKEKFVPSISVFFDGC